MTPPAALVVLPVLACLILLARASEGKRAWLTQLPIAAPLGVGLSSITWWAFLQIPAVSRPTMVALDAVFWGAAIGLVFLVRPERTGSPQSDRAAVPASRTLTWVAVAAFATTSALAVTSFAATSRVFPHAGWDAWAIWNVRARFLFRTGPGQWTDAFAEQLSDSHPDYPLLLPLSVSRAWTFFGEDTVLVPIIIGAIFAAATVAVAGLSVARARTPTHGFITATAILACPAFLKWGPSQCADVPLGLYMLITFVMMSQATTPGASRLWWMLAGISAGLAAWTKNEGTVFLLVFMALSTVWTLRKEGWAGLRLLLPLAAGAAVGVAVLVTFKWRFAPPNGIMGTLDFSTVTARAELDRLRFVIESLGREMWLGGASIVGVLPILCAYVGVVGIRRPAGIPAIAVLTMLLQVAVDAMVYVVTPYDLRWHVTTSVERVVLQTFPTVVWGLMMLTREPGGLVLRAGRLPILTSREASSS